MYYRRFIPQLVGIYLDGLLRKTIGVIFCCVCIFLYVSVFDYSELDASWNVIHKDSVDHVFGYVGSVVADLSFQNFGVFSFIFPIIFFYEGIFIFHGKTVKFSFLKMIAFFLWCIVSEIFLAYFFWNKLSYQSWMSYFAFDFLKQLDSYQLFCLCFLYVFGTGLFFIKIFAWDLKKLSKYPAKDNLLEDIYEFKTNLHSSHDMNINDPNTVLRRDQNLPLLSCLTADPIQKYYELSSILQQEKLRFLDILKKFDIAVEYRDCFMGPVTYTYVFQKKNFCTSDVLERFKILEQDLAQELEVRSLRVYAQEEFLYAEVAKKHCNLVLFYSLQQIKSQETFYKPFEFFIGRDSRDEPYCLNLKEYSVVGIYGKNDSERIAFLRTMLASLLMNFEKDAFELSLISLKNDSFQIFQDLSELLHKEHFSNAVGYQNFFKDITLILQNREKWIFRSGQGDFYQYKEFYKSILNEQGRPMRKCHVGFDPSGIAQYKEIEFPWPLLKPWFLFISGVDQILHDQYVLNQVLELIEMSKKLGVFLVLEFQNYVESKIIPILSTWTVFCVRQKEESRHFFGYPGGEKLLGEGDFIFKDFQQGKEHRVCAPFLSMMDMKKIIQFHQKKDAQQP